MSETPANRMDAVKSDGFIDFYELLGVEPDATVTRLRTTINSLYNEAQSNRDHRNLNRRREYQTLLQALPQARELLLDENKRERYDAFRDEVQRGTAPMSFEDWTRSLEEESAAVQGKSAAVLGIQDEERDGVPRATVMPTPSTPKSVSRVSVGDAHASRQYSAARQSLIGSAISIIAFVVMLIVSYLLFHDWSPAILVASITGLIVWVAMHRKSTGGTQV